LVAENLFSASASRERKFWGFLLFQKMLNDTPNYPELLTSIFSPNLVRCLINHLSKEDRFLHRAAEKSLRTLQQMVEANPHTIPIVLPKLISGNGFYNFDQVTKTKTVDKMLGWADGKDAEAVVQILLKPALIVEGCEDNKDAESRRQCFADYLLSMIRRVSITDESKDSSWVKNSGLPTLARLSYSKKHLKCKPELSEKSRAMFRTRLTSAFAHLISDPTGFSYPCELLQSIKADAVEMDDEVASAKDKALSTMEKLLKKAKKASEKEKKSLEALALLYSLVIFQLLNGESDAASVLDELKLCYDKLIRGKQDAECHDASQVLVEILLSLMSKPSVLLRKVAQHVFTAFSAEITAEGLSLMTDVLAASESAKGQQELFDQEDDEDEHAHDHGSDDDELPSDVEMIEPNNDHAASTSSSDEDSDADSSDEASTELDAALAAALGTHALSADADASDSDADMTDSEMLELDAKLVSIFAARAKAPNKKREKKDARATIVNFKTRVLDLLEMYVRAQPGRTQAYELLLPLLACMRATGAKQVAERAHAVVVSFAKAAKGGKAEEGGEVDVDERVELLRRIHKEAGEGANGSHAFAKAASTASLLVASSLWRVDRGLVGEVAGVYRDSQVGWVGGEGRVTAGFFHDWVNWCQSHVGA
jgi:DNA polymerase phi